MAFGSTRVAHGKAPRGLVTAAVIGVTRLQVNGRRGALMLLLRKFWPD
jgi:hypothetical protein